MGAAAEVMHVGSGLACTVKSWCYSMRVTASATPLSIAASHTNEERFPPHES
jgi:hypothetical protein